MNKTKIVSTGLLLTAMMLSAQSSFGMDLAINQSGPISLDGDVFYDIPAKNVEFVVNEPIICHVIVPTTSNFLNAQFIDPNGNSSLMPVLSSIGYNLSSQIVGVNVNNPDAVCATKNGAGFGDLIFEDGFEGDDQALRYQNLSNQIVKGQSLDYKIIVDNLNSAATSFDLVEYTSEQSPNNPAYIQSIDYWNCASDGVAGVVCNEDIIPGVLTNALIPVNGTVEIDVTRKVSLYSVGGQSIDFMTAVFVKNQQNEIIDVIVTSHEAVVVDNTAPAINWLGSTTVAMVEDDTSPQTLSFRVVDSTGANLSPGYLSSVIVDSNNKLDFSNINVVTNSSSDHTVNFDILPKANQFTGGGGGNNLNNITIQVEDAFGAFSNPLVLPVTIAPINDAPSFTVSCLDFSINPTPVASQTVITCNQLNSAGNGNTLNSTNWGVSDFVTNISAGGVGNNTESNQNVAFEIIPVSGIINQGSAMITIDPGTFIVNDLLLTLQDGLYGEGRFKVKAMDNGTPVGEVDQCPALSAADHCSVSEESQEIIFDLLEPVYFLSGQISGLTNQFDNIELNLFDSITGGSQVDQKIVHGLAGGGVVNFDFISNPLYDGAAYRIEFNEPGCEFIVNGNQAGDVLTGTINEQNVDDINITCI